MLNDLMHNENLLKLKNEIDEIRVLKLRPISRKWAKIVQKTKIIKTSIQRLKYFPRYLNLYLKILATKCTKNQYRLMNINQRATPRKKIPT